jgi:hypothetical protein
MMCKRFAEHATSLALPCQGADGELRYPIERKARPVNSEEQPQGQGDAPNGQWPRLDIGALIGLANGVMAVYATTRSSILTATAATAALPLALLIIRRK